MKSMRAAAIRIAMIVHAITAELRRLNSARIDSAQLASMPRLERTRLVKSALVEHHRHPNRCC
ncbi:MAG: hypothetical protein Q7S58_14925 [Candidatus Binatus sp.]|uniref:hypothetical protein n=1 Tax=Candidatus Binatus sp. TaxID=2811406 RepID=UPI00271B2BCC|nr:hypothetical protein [Candidatus Binatus sp.]MDO8433696.1 hypothetical protein [Candidatus Binatus sp.]